VEVFIASASTRVVKSLEAYDLLDDVGGLPLVQLEVEDVFWAVLEDLSKWLSCILLRCSILYVLACRFEPTQDGWRSSLRAASGETLTKDTYPLRQTSRKPKMPHSDHAPIRHRKP
jgi:hypothetical protein